MAEKGGMSAVPVFPQNMMAVKEENPRRFYGQCCYLVWWFILLSLFIVYASLNLKDFIEAQDNPVITSRIKRAEEIPYPLFLVCPFKAQPDPDFKIYGLFPEPEWYAGFSKDQNAFIDTAGGVKANDDNEKERAGEANDKASKADVEDLNRGNTGSLFPARKQCGKFVIKKPEDRIAANTFQNFLAGNLQTLILKSVAGAESQLDDNGNSKKKDKNDAAYYTCLVFNADRQITIADRERLGNPFGDEIEGCPKDANVADISDKDGNPKDREGQLPQATATDIGYFDGYVMVIRTYWKYEDDQNSGPDEGTILGLSISLSSTVDEIQATDAEYSSIGVPVGVTATLILKRIEFQCETCEDDELTIFFNATVTLIDLHQYPAVPAPTRADNSLTVKTVIQVFYQAMTVTSQREVITQGVLDYLGNFAGMCGTLLSFTVLGAVDRLCSYVFIGNGAMASVWDD